MSPDAINEVKASRDWRVGEALFDLGFTKYRPDIDSERKPDKFPPGLLGGTRINGGIRSPQAQANFVVFYKPGSTSRAKGVAEGIRREFQKLAEEWLAETTFESSPTRMFFHRAYQEIIGMGPQVIPLLLEGLEESSGHWYWALRSITRENPVPEEFAGDIPKMRDAWLDWGKRRGHLLAA